MSFVENPPPITNMLCVSIVDPSLDCWSDSAGFLQALTPEDADEKHWVSQASTGGRRTSFRRATLANWMTDVELGAGSLVARVIVNRVWQHHFGRGLVATPNDFGVSGDVPSHPQLLNWLAEDLDNLSSGHAEAEVGKVPCRTID